MSTTIRIWAGVISLTLCLSLQAQELSGIAVLPAETYVAGPSSGQFIQPANGIAPPFIQRQPIQGFSGLIFKPPETWLAISDNGFGSRANSADHLLRVLRLQPDFKTAASGSGVLRAKELFTLSDPRRVISFPLLADRKHYPDSDIPVDPSIRRQRLLTGADFDIESFVMAADGSFWFGDEFGPFLLHTDAHGRMLEPPVPLPGVFAPENPFLCGAEPNTQPSGGLEGLTLSGDGRYLYALMEKPLVNASPGLLPVFRFDLEQGIFSPQQPLWHYPLDDPGHRIGEILYWSLDTFLVIERDRLQGDAARVKRIYMVDASDPARVRKTVLADLLAIPDPNKIASRDGRFRYPFVTIEGIARLSDKLIAVINDNNFPFSVGRHQAESRPDDSELILIKLNAAETAPAVISD